jgi:hypothetical protein
MIDILLGKALVPVETDNLYCRASCAFYNIMEKENCNTACSWFFRKDGKNVYFKLLDYPASELRIDGMRNGSQVTSGV